MFVPDADFAYACRRSREEVIHAINASSEAAAAAHHGLAALYAASAVVALHTATAARVLAEAPHTIPGHAPGNPYVLRGTAHHRLSLFPSAVQDRRRTDNRHRRQRLNFYPRLLLMMDVSDTSVGSPLILIVDDDREIRSLLSQSLTAQGYRVEVAADARQMDRFLAREQVDLVVLDIMMPGEDGVSACHRITRNGGPAVILLSSMGNERDRVHGLESGAGHYLPKPCSAREVLATVRAALRERSLAEPLARRVFGFAGWEMNTVSRELVDPSGTLIGLTDGEFALLRAFVERPRRVLSREIILEAARGPNADAFDRAIDVQISRLRRKLHSPGDEIIRTIRNEGYMFVPTVIRN